METKTDTVSFDSRITPEEMYEFHMYHTYTSSQGWISIVFGIIGIVAGILTFGSIDTFYSVAYIVLGIVFLMYLPLILKHRAKVQVEGSEVLRNVLHYTFSDAGVGVSTDVYHKEDAQSSVLLPWDNVYRVVTTKHTLLIFSTRINAYVIPKREIEEKIREIEEILKRNLKSHRLTYRW